MLHRRSSAIAAGFLLLVAPVLSSCGFDAATDRVNTISSGINDRDGEIDVLGAAIIAGEDGAGLFVGSLANNSTTEPDSLTDVGGAVRATDFTTVDVPAGNAISLFDDGGIAVTGDFKAGAFVSVDLTFESGQESTVDVQVMKPCYQYDPAKFDPPLELPTTGTESSESSESSESAESSDSAAEDDADLYSCDPETEAPQVEDTEGGE